MASTYFHGGNSEIQASGDGLQTLYLMNPTYVPYSDTSASTPNMLFFNPNATSPHAPNLPHAPPPRTHQQHQLLGVIPTNMLGSENSDNIAAFHGFPSAAAAAPRVHNLWGSIIDQHQQTPSSPAAAAVSAAIQPSSSGMAAASAANSVFRRPSQQGLSLSLSSQQTAFNRSLSGELDVPGQSRVSAISPTTAHVGGGNDMQIMGNSPTSSSVSNGIPSMQSAILGSKYLKAAQELLDEVVNVGKGIEKRSSIEASSEKEKMKVNKLTESESGNIGGDGGGSSVGGGSKIASELSTAQRQELQMKKSKLVSMLDEVEQRYRQYRHQMQIVMCSFEQAAGYGAAKSYTALALDTISKQFRCLKDAVSSQIKATSKSLGEDDYLGAKVQGSRLRYVDHHLRQQRALQQLGMMQHNAWRPQRGLPERAVSILRAWLFEHFLHPYPKDSDKVMLAKQTGLTRSQVSNWFINARVRLWKPMVEEMYLEETKDQNNNNDQSNPKDNNNNIIRSSKESNKDPNNNNNNEAAAATTVHHEDSGSFSIIRSSFEALQSHNPNNDPMGVSNNNNNNVSMDVEMKPRFLKDGYDPLLNESGYGSGFSIQDIGRFNVSNVSETHHHLAPRFHGNGVSLTLGLPHHSDNLSLSATQHHGFLSHHNIHLGGTNNNATELCAMNAATAASGGGGPPPSSSHSGSAATGYENIDIQNRKSFAAQLLPDFVT